MALLSLVCAILASQTQFYSMIAQPILLKPRPAARYQNTI